MSLPVTFITTLLAEAPGIDSGGWPSEDLRTFAAQPVSSSPTEQTSKGRKKRVTRRKRYEGDLSMNLSAYQTWSCARRVPSRLNRTETSARLISFRRLVILIHILPKSIDGRSRLSILSWCGSAQLQLVFRSFSATVTLSLNNICAPRNQLQFAESSTQIPSTRIPLAAPARDYGHAPSLLLFA
jgi:hypothetical protein